jgi:hypothetical protein
MLITLNNAARAKLSQLDNREIIGAQLVPIDDLHKVPLTGPVQAYVRGQFSPIDGGAVQSVS